MDRAFDKDGASGADGLGALPRWNLADLYAGPEAPELGRDLDQAERDARAFRERFLGKLADLDGASLGRAVAEYEALEERLARAGSFAELTYAGDQSDPKVARFYQSVQERVNSISTHTLFFTLELNRLDDDDVARKLAAPELARYAPWLRDLRAFRPHQLADDMERLLHEKFVAGRAAWMRLFDETLAGLRFPIDGRSVTSAEALHLLSDRDPARRRAAAKSIGAVLAANVRLFALVTNTLAKDKEIDDKWRRYPRPISARNLSNRVEDEVVDALIKSVRDAYPDLSHRYYALKARWMGQDKLDHWDRNAPLPDADDRTIDWASAQDIVLSAYRRFSPAIGEIGERFFANAWIDAGVRAGKAPGAFAHPTVPSAHPYLLLNYQGKTRDVMTLAHELGHGVHQVLAGGQGHLLADTPLTLAETASVFGEMMTFQALLARESDPKRRRALLAGKVEDMLNTVVRQIAFATFETRLHDERRSGELTPDRINEIWLDVQRESLGPAFRFDDEYKVYWTYIPHFVHSPFYVYAYAFGDCLVNSLYAAYRGAPEGFAEKYVELLRAGGSKRYDELLRPFGLDARDKRFWQGGLALVREFVDELEALG
ncbi:MAG: M3 family oligoendopeptidase [Alphaproteobacteria bacterium]|nr:M3 family oligoendopeptidase [Alphaproteobacteria bacterium]